MIIIAGCIRVATGRRDDALTAISPMIESTRAEPGCVAYSFSFDVLDDHLLRIFEVFEDEAAVAAHRESAHMREWRTASALLGLSDRDLSQYAVKSRTALP
jgi:quinol monooxygenase YgiN